MNDAWLLYVFYLQSWVELTDALIEGMHIKSNLLKIHYLLIIIFFFCKNLRQESYFQDHLCKQLCYKKIYIKSNIYSDVCEFARVLINFVLSKYLYLLL